MSASDVYGQSFQPWRPSGMSDAVDSDFGNMTFVDNQRAAHNAQVRYAGDSLMSFANAYAAKDTADARLEAMKAYQNELPDQKSSGGLGGFGKIAGGILGSVVGGPLGGAVGSAAGGLLG